MRRRSIKPGSRPGNSRPRKIFSATETSGLVASVKLAMMRAQSPAGYAATLRWAHVPLAMFVLSIVWFVHFYFDAGKIKGVAANDTVTVMRKSKPVASGVVSAVSPHG